MIQYYSIIGQREEDNFYLKKVLIAFDKPNQIYILSLQTKKYDYYHSICITLII